MFDKTKEEEELELYQQYLNDMAGNPMEAQKSVDDARSRRDRAESVSDWGSLASSLGLLAGGLIGGVAGGNVGAGMATVAPSMGERIGQTGIARADRDLQEADNRRKEAMMASKEMRNVRREDVKDVRDAQAFETQQAQAEQGMQMGAMQIETLQRQMNDEASLRDPNSEISMQYRDIAEAMGYQVDENTNAFDIQRALPAITQAAQMDLQQQAARLQQAQFAEQKSQFDRTMQFNIDKNNQDMLMKDMARIQQMDAQQQAQELQLYEIAEQVTKPLFTDAEFKGIKEDINKIQTLKRMGAGARTNVQMADSLIKNYAGLLQNSARPAELQTISERGVGLVQGTLEKAMDMIGQGNVPEKVINNIIEAIELMEDSLLNTAINIQQPFVDALQDRGINPRYARQYLITRESFQGGE